MSADVNPPLDTDQPTAAARRARPPAQSVWRIDVLLVEDDVADRSLIASVLRNLPNVGNVRAADTANSALFELANGDFRPNLILLDINMPQINGFQFLNALRRIPEMTDVPVIFLTTSNMARDVEQARASSAKHYVVKPDTYSELQARLAQVVKRATAGAWRR